MSNALQYLDLIEMVFGVGYALFGRGPQIAQLPQWGLFLFRLIAPFVALGLTLIQDGGRQAVVKG